MSSDLWSITYTLLQLSKCYYGQAYYGPIKARKHDVLYYHLSALLMTVSSVIYGSCLYKSQFCDIHISPVCQKSMLKIETKGWAFCSFPGLRYYLDNLYRSWLSWRQNRDRAETVQRAQSILETVQRLQVLTQVADPYIHVMQLQPWF